MKSLPQINTNDVMEENGGMVIYWEVNAYGATLYSTNVCTDNLLITSDDLLLTATKIFSYLGKVR